MAATLCIRTAAAQDQGAEQEPATLLAQQPAEDTTTGVIDPASLYSPSGPASPIPLSAPAAPAGPVASGTGTSEALPDEMSTLPPVQETGTSAEPGLQDLSWHSKLMPHLRVCQYYDDNIFISHDHQKGDFVTIFGLGARMGFGTVENPLTPVRDRRGVPQTYQDPNAKPGNYLFVDYTGSPVIYANTPGQDTVNQDALLRGGWTDDKLSLALTSRFQRLTISDIDVGELVKQKLYTEALGAKYLLTDKTNIESNFSFIKADYPDQHLGSNDWLDENWLNWQATGKINTGPGVAVGYTEVEHSPDQQYEVVQWRAAYQFSQKLSFTGKAGLQSREMGGGNPSRSYPIGSFGATYSPFDSTSITLSSYRDVAASALLYGQQYLQTGVSLAWQQRIIDKLHLTLSVGYENLDYLQLASNAELPRTDDYFVGRAAVAFDFTRWCDAQLYYNYQKDNSTLGANSFVDNQVGIELNIAF